MLLAYKTKDLNKMTYSNDIRFEDMFYVRYEGLRLIPSKSARKELIKYGLLLINCKMILIEGYSPRKRKKGTIEKWLDKGDKTYNIVVVRLYNHFFKEDVYLITHIGKFSRK